MSILIVSSLMPRDYWLFRWNTHTHTRKHTHTLTHTQTLTLAHLSKCREVFYWSPSSKHYNTRRHRHAIFQSLQSHWGVLSSLHLRIVAGSFLPGSLMVYDFSTIIVHFTLFWVLAINYQPNFNLQLQRQHDRSLASTLWQKKSQWNFWPAARDTEKLSCLHFEWPVTNATAFGLASISTMGPRAWRVTSAKQRLNCVFHTNSSSAHRVSQPLVKSVFVRACMRACVYACIRLSMGWLTENFSSSSSAFIPMYVFVCIVHMYTCLCICIRAHILWSGAVFFFFYSATSKCVCGSGLMCAVHTVSAGCFFKEDTAPGL